MPRGIWQNLSSLLDDFSHGGTEVDVGHRQGRTSASSGEVLQLPFTLVPLQSRATAAHKAASFLGLSEPDAVDPGKGSSLDAARGHLDGPFQKSSASAKTSFFVKGFFRPKCRSGAIWSKVDKCEDCGDTVGKCSSSDCTLWEGKCISTTVGPSADPNDGNLKIGEWVYYWGASRPYKSGDWLKFGQYGQLLAPGTGKKEIDMTPADKADTRPWFIFHAPGNKKYTQVRSLRHYAPGSNDVEPASSEAQSAVAEWQSRQRRNLLAGMDIVAPCDKLGRIKTTEDGTFCEDNQACVTSLPHDFHKNTGKFCWKWVEPECKPEPCPQPPYCPPGTLCPKPAPCPPPQPCEKPHWVNLCKENQGQPWCVTPEAIKSYRRPLEIQCSASGTSLRRKKGSPDGCWWLNKFSHHDLQRLPGKINVENLPQPPPSCEGEDAGREAGSGLYVQNEEGALNEKQAEKWILTGQIDESLNENANSEFLKQDAATADGVAPKEGIEKCTPEWAEKHHTCCVDGDTLNCDANARLIAES